MWFSGFVIIDKDIRLSYFCFRKDKDIRFYLRYEEPRCDPVIDGFVIQF